MVPFVVVGSDCFRVSQVQGDAPGDAQLIDGDVGVSRDDCTR